MSLLNELKELSADELQDWADSRVAETIEQVSDSEAVSSAIAMTNATGCGVELHEVTDVKLAPDGIRARVTFQLLGDQDDDKPWHVTEISGEARVHIDSDGEVTYTNITADRDLGDDDYDPETFNADLYLAAPQPGPLVIDPLLIGVIRNPAPAEA